LEIVWWHHGDHILNELPEYLVRYCPVAIEMMQVLESLNLERFETDPEYDDVLKTRAKTAAI
jgi:hypothetical protein